MPNFQMTKTVLLICLPCTILGTGLDIWCLSEILQLLNSFQHILLMGALPIDSETLWALIKFFLLVKDKVRDFPLGFLPWDVIEKDVAQKTPRKKVVLAQ